MLYTEEANDDEKSASATNPTLTQPDNKSTPVEKEEEELPDVLPVDDNTAAFVDDFDAAFGDDYGPELPRKAETKKEEPAP